ncbi:hypothetical protein [Actinomadura sp. SCN-SB]|uniref:hypothetical protein n=1 Tax=Actinomadura sp. SCN-SB TaxID=3373092 RepID=UPI003752CD59
MDSIEFSRSGILINGVRLVDLVRQAELPFAMAGAYTGLLTDFYWPSRHFLGKPEDEPRGIREDGESVLLTCSGVRHGRLLVTSGADRGGGRHRAVVGFPQLAP